MKKYLVTFTLIESAYVEAETEEQAWELGFQIPLNCADNGDVDVKEVK